MRFASIASGSSGNCTYIGSEKTHILIDAGISGRQIEQGLNKLGLKASELNGIFITHEHSDHIQSIGVLSRKYQLPIYSTRETLEEIIKKSSLGSYPKEGLISIRSDENVCIGDLTIKPFRVDHDAANPVAYRVENKNQSVAVATDMGNYTSYVIDHLKGVNALLLEANHDVRMLESGSYPYRLKQRILSRYGHLSNESCGRLLTCILHDQLKKIFLGHLSRENNYEELAYETVRLEISQAKSPYRAEDFSISVARRREMSEVVVL